jgi:HEAT repeat protein
MLPQVTSIVEGEDVLCAIAALATTGAEGVRDILAARRAPWPAHRHRNDVDSDLTAALAAIAGVDPAPVIAALDGQDSRQALAWALGSSTHEAAIDALVALLRDGDVSVRWAAVVGLGRTRPARAFEPIVARLRDRSSNVRFAALEAVAGYDDPRVRTALRDHAARATRLLVGEEQIIEQALARLAKTTD